MGRFDFSEILGISRGYMHLLKLRMMKSPLAVRLNANSLQVVDLLTWIIIDRLSTAVEQVQAILGSSLTNYVKVCYV